MAVNILHPKASSNTAWLFEERTFLSKKNLKIRSKESKKVSFKSCLYPLSLQTISTCFFEKAIPYSRTEEQMDGVKPSKYSFLSICSNPLFAKAFSFSFVVFS